MTMLRRTLNILFVTAAVALMVAACGDGRVFDKFVSTPVDGLEKNDTVSFSVPPVASSGSYRQEIGLRITADYPFTSISLEVKQTVEPGHRVSTDTLACRLYDDDGNMLGRGVSMFQYGFALPDIDLRKGDSLHVRVRHVMKREILPGITDIGFNLEARR